MSSTGIGELCNFPISFTNNIFIVNSMDVTPHNEYLELSTANKSDNLSSVWLYLYDLHFVGDTIITVSESYVHFIGLGC